MNIAIHSPSFDPADSYGRLASELAAHWQAGTAYGDSLSEDAPCPLPDRPDRAPIDGDIYLGYPTNFCNFERVDDSLPRVAITMFEATRLPENWVSILNDCDAVIVPSTWCSEVFVDNGVHVPVHVVPLGVSETFTFQSRSAGRQPFTFLAIADRGERKGWHTACFAFVEAFGDSSDHRLILKCRRGALPFRFTNPNIVLIEDDYSLAQMNGLYGEADCLVFPSAGEGFGLPPLEMAATGGQFIATAWSSMTDYLDFLGGHRLAFTRVRAWEGDAAHGDLGGIWAKPDQSHLAALLKTVAATREEAFVSRQRSEAVRHSYSWHGFARGVEQVWMQVLATRGGTLDSAATASSAARLPAPSRGFANA